MVRVAERYGWSETVLRGDRLKGLFKGLREDTLTIRGHPHIFLKLAACFKLNVI